MNYHTVNIKKKYYKKIQEQAEKGIFGNTKAYILHSIANQMNKEKNPRSKDLGMQALKQLQEDPEVDNKKIKKALHQAAEQQLNQN